MPRTRCVPFGNVARYARTAATLRPEQLAHVVYRRLFPTSPARAARDGVRIRARGRLPRTPLQNRAFLPNADEPIVWQDATRRRLWRYHLHYFDFLNDPARSQVSKDAAIAAWIAHHPPGTPDAWEPYPASLRLVNWIGYLDASRAPAAAAVTSLHAQALWLERNLERRLLANHFLKNAKALAFAGLFFEGSDAERWLATGVAILRAELVEQFLADGGHFERSPMYHAIALADVLDLINLFASAHGAAPRELDATLRAIALRGLDFYDGILLPDGDIPLFNDAAFGVGPEPAELFAYARATVGYERPVRACGVDARAFEATGYYVIRDASAMAVVDCGDPGPRYQPGHGHADCLSYELAIAGRRVVVDSGVNDYEASAARRHARSTAAHSTVTIDGRDQSEMWGAFRVARRARPLAASLRRGADGVRFSGAHDGFATRGVPLVHERAIAYDGRRWSVEDRIRGRGRHTIVNRIHLAPGLRAEIEGRSVALRAIDSGLLVATVVVAPGPALAVEPAPYYPRFGVTEEASVIVLTTRAELPNAAGYTIEGA